MSKQDDELKTPIHEQLVSVADKYPVDSSDVRWALQGIIKAVEAYISTHYIAKAEVLRAIGEDTEWDNNPYNDTSIIENLLRAEIKQVLGLTSKEDK